MKVTFWGARGSISVFGNDYKKYGGSTTCLEVRPDDGKVIIIDAGTGIKGLGDKLYKERNSSYHMFITHTHWDHIQGFPFFKQIYDKKTHIRIYAPDTMGRSLEKAFNVLMQKVYHPIPFSKLSSKIEFIYTESDIIKIGKVGVERIRNNHPGVCHSLKISGGGKKFVFMTDNELSQSNPVTSFNKFVNFAEGADCLIHDSMYFDHEMNGKNGWGHSSHADVARLAKEAGVKMLGLFHHDPERKDKDIDKMVSQCQKKVGKNIKVFGVAQRKHITL